MNGTRRWVRMLVVVALAVTRSVAAAAAPGETTATQAYEGVAAGYTDSGHPYLGSLEAPVVLEEWSDYQCPFCARHFRQTLPDLLKNEIRTGRVRLVFYDFPLDGLHPRAAFGHIAARCAGEQGVSAYWAMHDLLFREQAQWRNLEDPQQFLAVAAVRLGLDRDAYARCITSGRQRAAVEKDIAAGKGFGFNGTPQFRISSARTQTPHLVSGAQPIARFQAAIEAARDGKAPPPAEAAKPAELPYWARKDGLAPDPSRPGYTLAGDAYKGDPAAPIVVVEFADYECEPCRRHAAEVQPAIDAALVDAGKVRWVSKHLPLREHPAAVLAAVAVECAGAQGRFWAMSDRVYATHERWANGSAERELPAIAVELGLDSNEFLRCFDGRAALQRVLTDLYDAQGYIDRTPSFVILDGGPTGSIAGPLPADQFVKLLEAQISSTPPARTAAR